MKKKQVKNPKEKLEKIYTWNQDLEDIREKRSFHYKIYKRLDKDYKAKERGLFHLIGEIGG